MRSYRLLLLDKSGLLVGNTSIDCLEEREAVAAAERNVHKCEYVEVWDGGRPVCICAKPLRHGFSLTKLFRRGHFFWSALSRATAPIKADVCEIYCQAASLLRRPRAGSQHSGVISKDGMTIMLNNEVGREKVECSLPLVLRSQRLLPERRVHRPMINR